MADYDADEGDLYIKFSEAEHTEGEPSNDGLVIVHYDSSDAIAAIEILNLADLWVSEIPLMSRRDFTTCGVRRVS